MKINGVEVKDADDAMTVVITKTDVRQGSIKEAKSCAAAQAICRQTGCDEARVHFSRAYIRKGKKWLRFGVPMALRNEIIAFDRGGAFEPGEYTLSPLQPTVRLDAPARTLPRRKTGKFPQKGKRPKRPYHVVSGVRKTHDG